MFPRLSLSTRILLLLDTLLAVLTGANVLLPRYTNVLVPPPPLPLPVFAVLSAILVFVLYGALGLAGLLLARRLGLPEIWDAKVTNRDRFLVPLVAGVVIGLFFIVSDLVFRNFNTLGALIHPPFPTSIIASAAAGIGEEMIFRLFLVTFLTWIVSAKLLKGRHQTRVYWAAAIVSALLFGLGHLPSVMFLYGLTSLQQVPAVFLAEILLLNGSFSLVAAYLMKKSGFLAAVGAHFWTDIVFHVIFGLL